MTNERIIVLGNDDNINVGTLHMNKIDITRSTVFEEGSVPELAINKKLLDRIDSLEKKIERLEEGKASSNKPKDITIKVHIDDSEIEEVAQRIGSRVVNAKSVGLHNVKIPDGHNTVFCGEEPDKFKEGDLWYSKNGSYSVHDGLTMN